MGKGVFYANFSVATPESITLAENLSLAIFVLLDGMHYRTRYYALHYYRATVRLLYYCTHLLKGTRVEHGAAVPDELVKHPLKTTHVALVRR